MPYRVKEIIKFYEQHGWYLLRWNGGSHRIYTNGTQIQVISGNENDEVDRGLERALLKRLGLKHKK